MYVLGVESLITNLLKVPIIRYLSMIWSAFFHGLSNFRADEKGLNKWVFCL